jgi:GPI-anchor transamidase subunit GAA1
MLSPMLTFSCRALCIAVGLGWLFVLPLNDFSRRNYISENALLPGQVEAYFGGSELNIIKAYRAEVESWASAENPDL